MIIPKVIEHSLVIGVPSLDILNKYRVSKPFNITAHSNYADVWIIHRDLSEIHSFHYDEFTQWDVQNLVVISWAVHDCGFDERLFPV